MPDYQNGKIYKITGGGLTYIGSTTQPLSKRMEGHRGCYKKYKATGQGDVLTSFKVLEFPNYDITLVEDYPCERKEQLTMRERFYIENMDCVNKNVPLRTYKEYCADNVDKILERHVEYRQKNKEKIALYRVKHREEHKEYIKEYQAQYEKINKEKIQARKKTLIHCECGSEFTNGYKSGHLITKKHQSYITLKNEQEQQVCLPSQK